MILEQSRAERNNYIDYLRGIAAIGIIAIHTAFYGGQSYTPQWFWNITLLLDVPFFYYLSGWSSSYRKSDVKKVAKSLINIWLKWIFFISVLTLFCYISKEMPVSFQGVSDVRELVQNFMFNVSFPEFCVVAGSIWFMPYYFVVILVNTIIIAAIQKTDRISEHKITYMWLLLGGFVWVSYGKYAFGIDLLYFLFYSFFWMMGMNRVGKTKTIRGLIVASILIGICVSVMSYLQGLPLYDLQSAKFPPSLKYGFASMFIILLVKFFEGKYKGNCKFLEHIGKNALFYYFGQGIGSSINFYVVNGLTIKQWFIKWIMTFIINVIITILVSEILAYTYKKLWMWIKVVKIK